MNVPTVPAFALAVVAAALTGCDTWPESAMIDRPCATAGRGADGPVAATSYRAARRTKTSPCSGSSTAAPAHSSARPWSAQTSVTTDAGGGIMLNVVDGELREVVRMVLESALHANYVIDPSVGGRITVQTTRPLPPQDLVPVLDAVLRMNGAALVQSGDLFKVVPIDQAITTGAMADVEPLPARGSPGFGVQVVPLRFVSATEPAPCCNRSTLPAARFRWMRSATSCCWPDRRTSLRRCGIWISIFDVDWMRGMSFGLFPLDNAAAPDLATELDQIFGGTEAGPLAGVVRVVPIERLNSVLVVSSSPPISSRPSFGCSVWTGPAMPRSRRSTCIPCRIPRAANLAEVLSGIFGAEAATVSGPVRWRLAMRRRKCNRTSSWARQVSRLRQRRPQTGARACARPARAVRRRAPLANVDHLWPRGREEGQPETRIIADDSTNSLVIRALPNDYRKIRDAIERLDTLPLQVLIEATVAEVTLSDQLRYGVEWFFRSGDFEATFSQLPTNAPVVGTFPGSPRCSPMPMCAWF